MSYMGVRVTKHSHIITIKLHGPLEGFPASPAELRQVASNYLNNIVTRELSFNMITDAHMLARIFAESYCNGKEVLWIEVIVQSPEDILYTAVEEGITTNV